ncbi:MAG: 3-deoxy-D-manno-octulosonic acid transferase [Desulfuromonadales bacterium]|nr:3-deoxy-D-manno-octulosonic acid transferase [Desulfuromonadales bacterium]
MTYFFYDLVLLASAAGLVPYYLYRGWRFGKSRRGIRERLGFFLPDRLDPLSGRSVIWIHAVSVGETRAAIPLVKALKRQFPEHALVVSNVTETGHAVAREIVEADLCLFFPFDLSWAVRRVLRQVRPSLIVIVETEIWPNFVRFARRFDIPVVLVNGRISDRSYPRYRRVRRLIRPVLEQFTAFCMQTAQDAERVRQLGGPAERIEVTRNLKFDMQAPAEGLDRAALRDNFRLPADGSVWAVGSTHPGEEEVVAEVYRRLLEEGQQLTLVLVPRHPERARLVAGMLAERRFAVTLRTRLGERTEPLRPGEILLVDTLGEMLKVYAAADLVFLGGSLMPIGGHNVLEAALLRRPVIFGPHMSNFREIARLLLEAGGGIQVEDAEGLHGAVAQLLNQPELRQRMGEGGNGLLQQNAGATRHTIEVLRRALNLSP